VAKKWYTLQKEMYSIDPNHNRSAHNGSESQYIRKNAFSSDLLSQTPEKTLNETQKNSQKQLKLLISACLDRSDDMLF
jgi:hypothetical protein